MSLPSFLLGLFCGASFAAPFGFVIAALLVNRHQAEWGMGRNYSSLED